jgi:ribose 5-phosphate isomerase RpiB
MLPVSAIGLGMVAAANLVEVAALVGDTARATMLNALMGGQSLFPEVQVKAEPR